MHLLFPVLDRNGERLPQLWRRISATKAATLTLPCTRGKEYLPYQLDYRSDQLQGAYPGVNAFFALKRKYDPSQLFTDEFYPRTRDNTRQRRT